MIEEQLDRLIIAIEKLTNVIERQSDAPTPIPPTVTEQPTDPENLFHDPGSVPAPAPDPDPVEYPELEQPAALDDIYKIMRQELVKVLETCGEDIALKLLEKYKAKKVSEIPESQCQSFLNDIGPILHNHANPPQKPELKKPSKEGMFLRIKEVLTEVIQRHGSDAVVSLLAKYQCQQLSSLPEKYYEAILNEAEYLLNAGDLLA